MNPFHNPVFLSRIIKSYFLDINRLKRFNESQLKNYQDKQLKKIVKYAYTVPMYQKIYDKAKVKPDDINGIKDIHKLPIISKDYIKKYYPEGIFSSKTKKSSLIEISTSATTGKKLTLFADMYDVVFWLFIYIRILQEYNLNWRKDKLSVIGDLAPHTIGSGFLNRGLFTYLNNDLFKNIQFLNTNDEPVDVIKQMDKFNPRFIGGYPGMLGHLALLKQKGFGENINPEFIATIGSVLDPSLKKLIEETFDAFVFEVYGATESGTIAYQCPKGNYHVMSDLVYLEFMKDDKPVSSGKPGNMIVTRLYGHGTPIIRYNSVNDIVAPSDEHCSCNMVGNLIKRIYGRDDLSLVFSGGAAMLASSFSEIYSRVLYELKTNKLRETKIIQHDLSNVEIQLVLDEKQKDKSPSFNQIADVIKDGFEKKLGSNVKILVKEVSSIDKSGPRIISKIDRKDMKITRYI